MLAWLDDVVGHFEQFDHSALVPARRIEYEVKANWKVIAENLLY